MPASEVKKIVPMSIWNSYYKFTIIRNPFDKIVSYFYHLLKIFRDNSFYDLPFRRKVHIIIWWLQTFGYQDDAKKFRKWVESECMLDSLHVYPGFVNDRDKYVINGELCIDDFIKTVKIKGDIRSICRTLNIPYEPKRIPRLKRSDRPSSLSLNDYYDKHTAKIISDKYRYEIDVFGYPDWESVVE